MQNVVITGALPVCSLAGRKGGRRRERVPSTLGQIMAMAWGDRFSECPPTGTASATSLFRGVLTPPAFACVLACGLSSFLLSVSQLWDGGCISQLTVMGDKESQGE